jgi:aerobic-type carbon monoxide dehydrogenase small subunit (CoxS/CutS family)
MIKLTVNGRDHDIDGDPDTPLLYVLRDELALNGAKYGCGLGQLRSMVRSTVAASANAEPARYWWTGKPCSPA